jgi:transcription termination factor NusB
MMIEYKGYCITHAYVGFEFWEKDHEEDWCEMADTIADAKDQIDDLIAEKIEDIWSCCGDKLPDNNVCPTCHEHN